MPAKIDYEKINKLLPNLPEAIYDLWLKDMISTYGWPPFGETWCNLLGGYAFKDFAKLEWKLTEIDLDNTRWTKRSCDIVYGLVDASFKGVRNEFSKIDPKQKIDRIIKYVKEFNKLPGNIILMDCEGEYEIVDGSHRITTFMLKGSGIYKCELKTVHKAWIGNLG